MISETQDDAIEDGGGLDCSETEKDRSEIHRCRSIGDPPEKDAIDRRSTGEGSMVGLIGDRGVLLSGLAAKKLVICYKYNPYQKFDSSVFL